ncbi:MAG: DUF6173 family protein [Yoonia sp.]|jgi:hypothetical protein|nr:DUF6173 family protein [Yoonia sp.]
MIKNQDTIETSADAMENAHLPTLHEIHLSQAKGGKHADLPKALKEPVEKKSPAQWAYERIIMYIKKFEETLDNDHEVGLGFAGGDAGVIKIEGLGYFDPDIVTYFGTNGAGAKTQLIQHVGQLNVMLTASPKHIDQAEPNRIGFQLAQELDRDEDATT